MVYVHLLVVNGKKGREKNKEDYCNLRKMSRLSFYFSQEMSKKKKGKKKEGKVCLELAMHLTSKKTETEEERREGFLSHGKRKEE